MGFRYRTQKLFLVLTRLSMAWLLPVTLAWAQPAAATLSGQWRLMELGSGASVTVVQRGNRVKIRRTLEIERGGDSFALQHLYKGKLSGTVISGRLFVKQGKQRRFHFLRDFEGTLQNDDSLLLDGYRLKRQIEQATHAAADIVKSGRETKSTAAAAVGAPLVSAPPDKLRSGAARTTALRRSGSDERHKPPDPAGKSVSAASDDLLTRAKLPKKARRRVERADGFFAAGKYRRARRVYQKAQRWLGKKDAALLHRIAKCHLQIGAFNKAQALLNYIESLQPGRPGVETDLAMAIEHRAN